MKMYKTLDFRYWTGNKFSNYQSYYSGKVRDRKEINLSGYTTHMKVHFLWIIINPQVTLHNIVG